MDEGVSHFGPEQPAVAVPEPGHGHLGGARSHAQPRRDAGVAALDRLPHQETLELIEQSAAAGLGEFPAQPAENPFQQRGGPALVPGGDVLLLADSRLCLGTVHGGECFAIREHSVSIRVSSVLKAAGFSSISQWPAPSMVR